MSPCRKCKSLVITGTGYDGMCELCAVRAELEAVRSDRTIAANAVVVVKRTSDDDIRWKERAERAEAELKEINDVMEGREYGGAVAIIEDFYDTMEALPERFDTDDLVVSVAVASLVTELDKAQRRITEAHIPRGQVQAFTLDMETRLRANDHKGSWGKCSLAYLLSRLKEEMAELDAEVYNNDPRRIIDEAADVANFAMMIADNARRILIAGEKV